MSVDTSLDAWSIVKTTLGARQQMVYDHIVWMRWSLTSPEIAKWLHLPLRSVAPRITELTKLGLIVKHERRVCTVTGGTAYTWRAKIFFNNWFYLIKWRRLNDSFREDIDWKHVRYFAVSNDKEKSDIADFSKLYPYCERCLSVRTDNGKLCRECSK